MPKFAPVLGDSLPGGAGVGFNASRTRKLARITRTLASGRMNREGSMPNCLSNFLQRNETAVFPSPCRRASAVIVGGSPSPMAMRMTSARSRISPSLDSSIPSSNTSNTRRNPSSISPRLMWLTRLSRFSSASITSDSADGEVTVGLNVIRMSPPLLSFTRSSPKESRRLPRLSYRPDAISRAFSSLDREAHRRLARGDGSGTLDAISRRATALQSLAVVNPDTP